MRNTPSNSDNVVDSRDIIERIKELESLQDDATDESPMDEDDAEELKVLLALQGECEGYSDWRHGETLIRSTHFEDYAQELAEDIGAIDRNAKWPMSCIDWEQAARELQTDYSIVDWDGVDYLIRG